MSQESDLERCDFDALDGLVRGQTAPEVEAHAAVCAACREELTARKAEQALFAARRQNEAALPPALWQGVVERVAPPVSLSAARHKLEERAARWATISTAIYGLAAAAGLLFMLRGPLGRLHPAVTPTASIPTESAPSSTSPVARRRPRLAPDVALAQAEREYQDAVAVLEAEYRQERGLLPAATAVRYDREFQKTRDAVAQARAAVDTGPAGHDLDARVTLLDGYADYEQSLQTVVSDLQSRRK